MVIDHLAFLSLTCHNQLNCQQPTISRRLCHRGTRVVLSMWNPNQPAAANSQEEDDSWEVRAFAEDTGNIMGTTWPPRSYTCTFCRREFRSAQALGGHMNVHRRDRARLHQSQPNSKNPYISSSNINSSTQELVGNGGLCFLYSLPSPNALFSPLKTFTDNPSSLVSIASHPTTTANLMNFAVAASPSNSSNTEASNNRVILTNSAVEEIDLELRLGRSS